jgi:hypothetical protein
MGVIHCTSLPQTKYNIILPPSSVSLFRGPRITSGVVVCFLLVILKDSFDPVS